MEEEHEEDLGYIAISKQYFSKHGAINGVSFTPCQRNEWFFVGLSNADENYHGQRDAHYDDIDFCIFCQGESRVRERGVT